MQQTETQTIRIGDYIVGKYLDTQGFIRQVEGFVDFISPSHIELHNRAMLPLIPTKYQIEKLSNVVSIKHWRREQDLAALEG